MAYIIAIDPGPDESAYVILNTDSGFPGGIEKFGKVSEQDLKLQVLDFFDRFGVIEELYLAVEFPASYGMAVGRSVFDTCAVAGRFEERFVIELPLSYACYPGPDRPVYRVYRKRTSDAGVDSVSMSLCKNPRANDSNVRQAIIDLYPAVGGGKTPQIGSKKEPGPLYGISKDVWAALAVGLTFQTWLENVPKQ